MPASFSEAVWLVLGDTSLRQRKGPDKMRATVVQAFISSSFKVSAFLIVLYTARPYFVYFSLSQILRKMNPQRRKLSFR